MLDENCQLIQSIIEHHNQGKINEAAPFQQQLHKNLVYLATVADSQGPGSIQARVVQFLLQFIKLKKIMLTVGWNSAAVVFRRYLFF